MNVLIIQADPDAEAHTMTVTRRHLIDVLQPRCFWHICEVFIYGGSIIHLYITSASFQANIFMELFVRITE